MYNKVNPLCYPCVLNQALSTAKHLDLCESDTKDLLSVAMNYLEVSRYKPMMVQHIVRYITDVAQAKSGKTDVYHEVKLFSHKIAQKYAEQMRTQIPHHPQPLQYAIKLAAAGNIIDFGAKSHGDLDIEAELQQVDNLDFSCFDFDALNSRLSQAKNLLYICDNVGELDFDKLLMEQIVKDFPNLQIYAAFRHTPIINDATLEDAHQAGIADFATVLSSGSVYPGTILAEASSEFLDLYKKADVIIAKGQGNYETMYLEADARLFFILRIKCEPMAMLAQEEKDSLVLMKNLKA